jgi:hypothetical protein
MKIKELLSDDDLYELWMLVGDAVWDVLINNYSANDITEAIHRRRAVRKVIRRPIVNKPTPRPLSISPFFPKVGFEVSKPDKRSF